MAALRSIRSTPDSPRKGVVRSSVESEASSPWERKASSAPNVARRRSSGEKHTPTHRAPRRSDRVHSFPPALNTNHSRNLTPRYSTSRNVLHAQTRI
ncbi:hypothetical protein CEXT_755961 [Caerostris extrusa]|uniref:Uncharacterized protein n=1 Tax=Caerostris extrusa TaxID=172846 RepID=A0AAV4R5Z7_CAEEX|nr:hypothetical protein CEXT_755961 [Caerostris extrusa]